MSAEVAIDEPHDIQDDAGSRGSAMNAPGSTKKRGKKKMGSSTLASSNAAVFQVGKKAGTSKVRAGGGLEPKRFIEIIPEELEELQQESRDRKASASRQSNPVLRFLLYVRAHPLLYQCIAECVGTFILTWIITCNIAGAVIANSNAGLWDVAIVCGLGLMLAIFCTAAISGGHLNPAVSLSFALVRPEDFPLKKLFPYVVSQFVGAFIAGLLTYGLWFNILDDYFEVRFPSLARGKEGSSRTEIIFAGIVPNPAYGYGQALKGESLVYTPIGAACVEGLGAGFLVFIIFAITHPLNRMVQNREWVPFVIGLTLCVLIVILGPITSGSFNPARDFAPRIVTVCFGWGHIGIPGPHDEFWAYIVGPLIGGPIGAFLHDYVLAMGYKVKVIKVQ